MIKGNKSNKQKTLTIGVAAAFILVLGGASIFFVQQSHWTTFKKTKYGYSFRYPKDWVAVNDQDSNPETRIQSFRVGGKQLFNVFLLFPNPDICADLKTCAQKNQQTYTTIKGQPFEDIGLLREERHGPNAVISQYFRWPEGKSTTYFLFQGGVLATFTNYGVPERQVNKIIASFRIESPKAISAAMTINLASWRTYSNTAYGLQFQFPSYWSYPNTLDPTASYQLIGLLTGAGSEGSMEFYAHQGECTDLTVCVEAKRQEIRNAANSYVWMYPPYSDWAGSVKGMISLVRSQGYTEWYYYYLYHGRLIELSFRDYDNDISNAKIREAIIASLKFN